MLECSSKALQPIQRCPAFDINFGRDYLLSAVRPFLPFLLCECSVLLKYVGVFNPFNTVLHLRSTLVEMLLLPFSHLRVAFSSFSRKLTACTRFGFLEKVAFFVQVFWSFYFCTCTGLVRNSASFECCRSGVVNKQVRQCTFVQSVLAKCCSLEVLFGCVQ